MKTLIIVGQANDIDRRDLEDIENTIFEDTLDFWEKTKFNPNTTNLYELTDFMDSVNNQELEDFSDYFIGYIHILKN